MKNIFTENAPVPAGHYSQAVVHNGLVFVSGQLAVDPETKERKTGPVEEETKLVLSNISGILKAAGSDKNNVIKTTVYVSDISLWDRVNKVYADFFGEHKPARAVVPTKELHFGFKVEIEAVAAVVKEG